MIVSTKPTVGRNFRDVLLAPRHPDGIFHAAFYRHHFEQRMIQQLLDVAAEHRVQIPELINLHQARVIARHGKIRVGLQKQIRHVVQMHQPVQRGRTEAVLLAKFVGRAARRIWSRRGRAARFSVSLR